ncbi:MAG: FAD-dependent oxidoreductase [Anaerolineales bacterium]|jgi:glycine/D-amino acid oxidase-like deaminating enzyme
MKQSDVIIIGGGIIGACCADALTQRGLTATLLERRFAASGSSRACDGLILLWDKNPGPEMTLGKRSVSLWEKLAPQLDPGVEFRKSGTILINETPAGLDDSARMVADVSKEGVTAEPLDAPGLNDLEPGLASDLAGGFYFPDDYQIDPRRATLAILHKAVVQGLDLRTGEEVQSLRRAAPAEAGWEVVTQNSTYAADCVVCAAGVWSNSLLQKIGIEVPVRPRKGHILVVQSGLNALRHPVLEGGYEATVHAGGDGLQIALVAEVTAAGTMLIGSSRQFAGFDTSVSWEVLRGLARHATRFIPRLAQAPLIRSYAGLRPWSPDHLPLIGPVDGWEGLYLATGHEGAGICLAPATGELIAKWIAERQAPEIGGVVSPARFL